MSEAAVEGFGIPPLDRLLSPVPRHASLLLENDPGVDAEPFLLQLAHHHLAHGEEVLFAVTDHGPATVMASMASHGFDLPDGARLHFLDAFSRLMGRSEQALYEVRDPTNPAHFMQALERAARERPGAVLILDSLSSLADRFGPEELARIMPALLSLMRRFSFAVGLFTKWPYENGLQREFKKFEGLVRLRGVQERVVFGHYFAVERASWEPKVDARPRLYKVTDPGGVLVYIPKIVVTGPYAAGKSTFIKSVSDASVSVNRMGTTVAMDHGHLEVDGISADIFGTPGQARFDPILKTIAAHALGVVLVVDATQPDTMERAREMLDQVWKQGLPVLVAANKQDVPGALAPPEVLRRMKAPPSVRSIACVAQDQASCRRVLHQLIDQITGKSEEPEGSSSRGAPTGRGEEAGS